MEKRQIKIKETRKGAFNKYCKSKGYKSVTRECEEEGLVSELARIRKMAQFSKNSRSWNKGDK